MHNHILFFDYPPLQRESSKSLREHVDTISRNLRSLTVLQLDIFGWDLLIIHLVSAKLDKTSSKLWKEYNNSDELPTLEEFKTFLKNRADLLKTIEYTEPAKGSKHPEVHPFAQKGQKGVK